MSRWHNAEIGRYRECFSKKRNHETLKVELEASEADSRFLAVSLSTRNDFRNKIEIWMKLWKLQRNETKWSYDPSM